MFFFPGNLKGVIISNIILFSHAAIRFNKERVAEILKCKNLKIGGKKVFVFPAYTELLRDDPNLGEPEIVEKFDEESDEKSNGESDEESENVTTVVISSSLKFFCDALFHLIVF